MTLFFISYISGILSGVISVIFRNKEIEAREYTFGKQLLLQIILFFAFYFLLREFFIFYELHIFGYTLSWFYIFFIIMNLSYYKVKIIYEWWTGFGLYPSEKELEEFMEKKSNEL